MAKKTIKKNAKTTAAKTTAKRATRAAAAKATQPVRQQVPENVENVAVLEPGSARPETATMAEPRARDPRLPAPGTVLRKKDRQGHVRCECTVEDAGIRYNGTVYRSLSAAAMAASKDLGLGGRAQNGFLFWGLISPAPRDKNQVAALEHAWRRYWARASGALAGAKDDDSRARIKDAITRQASALAEITHAT